MKTNETIKPNKTLRREAARIEARIRDEAARSLPQKADAKRNRRFCVDAARRVTGRQVTFSDNGFTGTIQRCEYAGYFISRTVGTVCGVIKFWVEKSGQTFGPFVQTRTEHDGWADDVFGTRAHRDW